MLQRLRNLESTAQEKGKGKRRIDCDLDASGLFLGTLQGARKESGAVTDSESVLFIDPLFGWMFGFTPFVLFTAAAQAMAMYAGRRSAPYYRVLLYPLLSIRSYT